MHRSRFLESRGDPRIQHLCAWNTTQYQLDFHDKKGRMHRVPPLRIKPLKPLCVGRVRNHAQRAVVLRVRASNQTLRTSSFDVVIVGAGVVGLCIAHSLLESGMSVAIVEQGDGNYGHVAGRATGAGQGYIWLAHRAPNTPMWDLAVWSKRLWRGMLQDHTTTYLTEEAVEWQGLGSILLASHSEEVQQLVERQKMLLEADLQSDLLDANDLKKMEPALAALSDGAGLLVTTDSQLNGQQTARALLQQCCSTGTQFQLVTGSGFVAFASEGDESSSRVTGVVTTEARVLGKLGVVVAAGAWTGQILKQLAQPRCDWENVLLPRRGHLLEVEAPLGMPHLQHGLMEVGYARHYATANEDQKQPDCDITFTATMSAAGSLLIGSSREMGTWGAAPEPAVVNGILDHAINFLPDLGRLDRGKVDTRVGLRPFCVRGQPLIGPVPGSPGLYIAAGHEGSGLTLGPATGEIIRDWLLDGRPLQTIALNFLPPDA